MKPTESLKLRLEMSEMHESILARINDTFNNEQYVETCWLCYSCFESRVNRALSKICSGCNKPIKNNRDPVSISTKLGCFERLIQSNYIAMADENIETIVSVKNWCQRRNKLVHAMLEIERYKNVDSEFKNLAEEGITLVKKMYEFGSDVRQFFYRTSTIPNFDDEVVKVCRCKTRCLNFDENIIQGDNK